LWPLQRGQTHTEFEIIRLKHLILAGWRLRSQKFRNEDAIEGGIKTIGTCASSSRGRFREFDITRWAEVFRGEFALTKEMNNTINGKDMDNTGSIQSPTVRSRSKGAACSTTTDQVVCTSIDPNDLCTN
jgi:hypothetical protein